MNSGSAVFSKSAVTIGNFDGVHRGHIALIESITQFKREHSTHQNPIRSVVLTFDPHPIEVLRTGTEIKKLTPAPKKNQLLQSKGVDEVRVIHFTPEFSKTSAKDFFEKVLLKDLDAAYFAVGSNFFFGHNREGTPSKLIEWCLERNIQAKMINAVEADGAPISSSRIRQLIQDGQLVAASRLLGRDFTIEGTVVHGNKKGRLLGFPTANLVPVVVGHSALCLPANGVYLTHATINGKTFAAVTNVGVKPTLEFQSPLIVETHLLDFTGDLYGKHLTVEFRDRLRPEKKFSNFEELQAQILKDTELARERLRHG
jgi:riboflavin kinase/FMN adenylyltransferase